MTSENPQARWPEWMDLQTLSSYSCTSEKTLRAHIRSPTDPLPASRRRKGKLYVRRSDFDAWMQRHPVERIDIDQIVQDIVNSVTAPKK
jgi:hypothetical protein